MTKYILEIKNRSILLSITCLSTLITSYFYKETLLFLLTQSFVNNYSSYSTSFYFIFTDITEIFSVYLQLVSFVTIQIAFLTIVYHSFIFFSPALFNQEYRNLSLILKTTFIIWFFSLLLSNYFLIPLSWNFFLSFQDLTTVSLHFEAKLNEYLSFYIVLYYLCIFYCQVFSIVFLFLSYINANVVYVKRFRKLYYYLFVVFATLLSPPEIFSQIVISFFVIFVYELLLFLFLLRISLNS